MKIEAELARLGYVLPEATDSTGVSALPHDMGIEIDPRKPIDAL
jgi:hypothetical protein